MTEREVVRRYNAGESVNRLAAALGTYNAKVKRLLLSRGVLLRTKAEQNRIAGAAKRRPLSSERLRSLYERYLAFEPLTALARSARIEHRRLADEFRAHGWALRSRSASMTHANAKRRVISDAAARQLRGRYERGESADTLAKELGLHPGPVRSAIRRAGGTVRTANEAARRCALNERAFDRLTPESAYWLGMLITDGSVSKAKSSGPNRSPTIKLALKRRDRAHIEAFRRFMGSTHKIFDGHGRVEGKICPTSEIGFSSRVLAEKLKTWGVTQRKSQTATAHRDLAKDRDFWRGVVDGDGCLGIYEDRGRPGPRMAVGGSEPLMRQFAAYCEPLLGHRPTPRAHRTARMWEFKLAGRDTMNMVKHLYANAAMALARKAVMAARILDEFKDNDWRTGPKPPVRAAYFDERLDRLRTFAKEHGHAEVPSAYTVSGVRLGRWVQRQRDHYRLKLERLTPERIHLLEEVPGWAWTVGKGRSRQG